MSKGKPIDLGIDGVSAELSPDGQSRVILKLRNGHRLFPEETRDLNLYARGAIKRNPNSPGTVQSQEMGMALAELPGVTRIQFRRNEGAFVDIDIHCTYLVSYLKRVAAELLDYAMQHRETTITTSTTNP